MRRLRRARVRCDLCLYVWLWYCFKVIIIGISYYVLLISGVWGGTFFADGGGIIYVVTALQFVWSCL